MRASWKPVCRRMACHGFGTLTHLLSYTLLNLIQRCRVYTHTNPISPFRYYNSLPLICLFEMRDESAIFSGTQRRPYPHLFVHVKSWVISQHDWLVTSGGVCAPVWVCMSVFLFISLIEWVQGGYKAICPSRTPNTSLSLCLLCAHTHTHTHTYMPNTS